jgi:betaine lipid synthase
MDHLDWFSPGSVEVQEEVDQFKRVLAAGGMVFWRSASRKPWYNEMQVPENSFLRLLPYLYFMGDRFQQAGFEVTPVAIRTGSIAIDRVNMSVTFHSKAFTLLTLDRYASCWRAVKS